MNFEQRYNTIIDMIENAIEESQRNIPKYIAERYAQNERLLGDAFLFITDMTLNQYIKQRKLIHAMKYKFEFDVSFEEVADVFGFSDSAAFSKAFKNIFGKSPSQFTPEDLNKHQPLKINVILEGANDNMSPLKMTEIKNNTRIFGIPEKQFSTIKQALEINTLYGFSDEYMELVYQIYDKLDVSLHDIFSFVEEYLMQIENGTYFGEYDIVEIARVSLSFDLSFNQSKDMLHILHSNNIDSVLDLPDGFFDIYFSEMNDRLDLSIQEIINIIVLIKQNNLSPLCFNDVALNAIDFYNGDIYNAIKHFEADNNDLMSADVGLSEIDKEELLFGFYSIWDVLEPEY